MIKKLGFFTLTAILCMAVLGGCGSTPAKNDMNPANNATEEKQSKI